MKASLPIRLIRLSACLFALAFIPFSHTRTGRLLQWAGAGTMLMAILAFCRERMRKV